MARVKLYKLYTVNPVGKSGGLALLWKNSVQIDFKFVDKNLLDMLVQFGNATFFISCVYGEPVMKLRHIVWERLTRFGCLRPEAWCMIGDFNDILNNGEKIGGPSRSDKSFEAFSDMLRDCQMSDLPSTGNSYTWGGWRHKLWIQCKLDRCFVNKNWIKVFPTSNQAFLAKRGSDHRPVLVRLLSASDSYRGSFRFDKRFLDAPLVKDAITQVWNQVGGVAEKIRGSRKALSQWKKSNNMNSLEKISKLQLELELEQSALSPSTPRITILRRDLVKAYKEEEAYWSQKSKDRWVISGDQNSKFFHDSVKSSRNKNRIDKLIDANGITQKADASMGEVAIAFFSDLYKSSTPADFQQIFNGFQAKVTTTMNDQLIQPVTKEEVEEAVFSIKPSSAPGSDGMTGLFYQRFWDVLGDQVTNEVQNFFEVGSFPSEWNYTQLCLLPKIVKPSKMMDFRPISLCSVLYKIISKVLVKRLQPLLSEIISPTQSAFVSERLISDNIIIAHELIHALRTHPTHSKDFIALKSDMSKAFDRVDWRYLQALLLALGFHPKWVKWIMECITTVTYSVLINNQPFGMITPTRGSRQGDPLSPFLFILCTEGLIHLLNTAEKEGLITGLRFSHDGPSLTHLLLADDSLFVCKAQLA